jgi:hypothetical protein
MFGRLHVPLDDVGRTARAAARRAVASASSTSSTSSSTAGPRAGSCASGRRRRQVEVLSGLAAGETVLARRAVTEMTTHHGLMQRSSPCS